MASALQQLTAPMVGRARAVRVVCCRLAVAHWARCHFRCNLLNWSTLAAIQCTSRQASRRAVLKRCTRLYVRWRANWNRMEHARLRMQCAVAVHTLHALGRCLAHWKLRACLLAENKAVAGWLFQTGRDWRRWPLFYSQMCLASASLVLVCWGYLLLECQILHDLVLMLTVFAATFGLSAILVLLHVRVWCWL